MTNPNQEDKELIQSIYKAVSIFYNYTGDVKCYNTTGDPVLDGWDFQTCSEMVMPVCSNGVNDMFENNPWDLNKFIDNCYKQWNFKPEPYKIETLYGGMNITAASNIIFRCVFETKHSTSQ